MLSITMNLPRSLPIAALLFLLPVGVGMVQAHEVTSKGVTIAHPWVRATPGGVTNGAAYLEIKAADGVNDRLISASSPAAARVEVHTHIKDGEVMRMRRVDDLALKPASSVVLRPSGDHLMLMDLKAPLKEGDLVTLELMFEKAGPIVVEATVEPVGAKGPHGMDHQPGHEPAAGGKGHGEHKH
jgi:periplasmic copper chaperone A